jgi:hypothetical protein
VLLLELTTQLLLVLVVQGVTPVMEVVEQIPYLVVLLLLAVAVVLELLRGMLV